MRIYGIFLFIFSFISGVMLINRSWNGVRYVSVGSWRTPAAVHGLHELSSLRETSPMDQSSVTRTDSGLEVELSQFVMRDQLGLKNFVCQVEGHPGVFDRVELVMIGVGISEAGRTPQLRVSANCLSAPNAQEIGPIRVPVPMAKIYQLKPIDQELRFYDPLDSVIQISQMVSEWPTQWRLQSIRYFDSQNPDQMLTFDSPQSESSATGALTLNWDKKEQSF